MSNKVSSLPSDGICASPSRPARNYPYNCWWVAAKADELGRKPFSRWLLERRIVLFRREDGAPVVLEDRCAHRWAPLSGGKLIGDEIECPYHGFRYDARGACTLVPTLAHVPPTLKVRSYPVREHGSLVWIWVGDPQKADPALLPQMDVFTSATYWQRRWHWELHCNYFVMQENLLDLSHVSYLHENSLKAFGLQSDVSPAGIQQPAQIAPHPSVQATDRTVSCRFPVTSAPIAPSLAKQMGIEPARELEFNASSTFESPACYRIQAKWEDRAVAAGHRAQWSEESMHFVTPISATRCHYWVARAQDYGTHLPELASYSDAWVQAVVQEDRAIVEAIQTAVDQAGGTAEPDQVLVRADRALVEARRILERMLDAE